MSASTAIHAMGGEFKYSSNDSSYATLGEIVDVQAPKWMTAAAKATHLQSPNSATEATIGVDSSDPLKATMNFTKAEYTTVVSLKRTKGYFKVFAPTQTGETTPSSWKFYGFITKIGTPKMDPEDNNAMIYELEVTRASGTVTYLAGS